MATSPNYAWAEPDNSSLVKNGAADIRTLGDAIDTSVWNIGYGQAGKNELINGDFGIWQRGTSFASPSGTYTSDRWLVAISGGSLGTCSQQTFTPATAPVAGYEGQFFLRMASNAGATYLELAQRVEDVRSNAGRTVTLSFWAKATSSVTFTPLLRQNFGSGGSANVDNGGSAIAVASSSWTRYSVTVSLPSLSGKTIGTSSYLGVILYSSAGTTASNTVDFWGVQLEYGSKATPFQTASGGSPQAELAMCQRYYWRTTVGSSEPLSVVGGSLSTTIGQIQVQHPVSMRSKPTILETDTININVLIYTTNTTVSGGTFTLSSASPDTSVVRYTHGSVVFTVGAVIGYRAAASAYLGLSAEL
jgi:hypothetical protein